MNDLAIDQMSTAERAIVVRMIAAAALSRALNEITDHKSGRPERLGSVAGRDVHGNGDREHHDHITD